MKLGVAGLLGDGSREAAARIRSMGFTTASWHLPSAEAIHDLDRLDRVRDALRAENVELCQLLPPAYPSLVDPDPAVRGAGVRLLARVLEAARRLGAGSVYVRPGSLNPAGAWTPHPDNHRLPTRRRLVESLRQLAPSAEAAGVPLTLEAHVVSPLFRPSVVREVLDEVSSSFLRFNLDPVNLVGTIDQAYDSGPLLDELFETLGDAILVAHAKDVTVGNRLVVHIDECIPGRGYLDHQRFLAGFERCCPRGAVLIEHLPSEHVPEARRALLDVAARAGVHFEES